MSNQRICTCTRHTRRATLATCLDGNGLGALLAQHDMQVKKALDARLYLDAPFALIVGVEAVAGRSHLSRRTQYAK